MQRLNYIATVFVLLTAQLCFGGNKKTVTPKASVSISYIKTNKILYSENDSANITTGIVNETKSPLRGTIVVRLYHDLGKYNEIVKQNQTLRPGTQSFRWKFNVGPQTYGRAVEVVFVDKTGRVATKRQEYFQVAREWLRVQMHSRGRYNNHKHWFASEPTDFGVQPTDVERYLSGQTRFKVPNRGYRKNLPSYKQKGIKTSFYQSRSFAGIMGYEQVRQHPEYVLYDKNGQFGVDPVYGGYPNPMEVAAPLEMGRKRKELIGSKSYLDRPLTAWHHVLANFANLDAIRYGTECMRSYVEKYGYDCVYLDDTPSLYGGFNAEGKSILAGMTDEQLAQLNTNIAHLWQKTLKEKDPYFATWFNAIGPDSIRSLRERGLRANTMGTGVDVDKGDDVNDKYIRELTSWKNTSFLLEIQHPFSQHDYYYSYPEKWAKFLLENRNYSVQKYKANAVFGYICVPIHENKPGHSQWSWSTINSFLAIAIATQHHYILLGESSMVPSAEPFNQFATRYSRFLWARDIKAMPLKKVKETLKIKSRKKLWWKDFVYTRKTKKGEDIIIHLVRPYPLEKWDLDWEIRPAPVKDVVLSLAMPSNMKLKKAYAVRQYHFGEPKQVVEKAISPITKNNAMTFKIPGFRYYTMIVLSFVDSKKKWKNK